MQPLAIQYNLLAGGQALDSTLQSVISQVVAAMTAAFTEIKGATWSATDTLEQIRDNASGLDAAGVRFAIGLASANLDTQLNALPTASENADAVWDEPYAAHTTAGTFGKLMDILRKSNRAIEGVTSGAPTDTVIQTNLVGYPDTAFNHELFLLNGTGIARPILTYSATNGTITLQEPLPTAPSAGVDFVILPQHIHPISEIADAISTIDIDGTLNLQESLLVHNAALTGKTIPSGSQLKFRNIADTKDVITATVVGGARTDVVVDPT